MKLGLLLRSTLAAATVCGSVLAQTTATVTVGTSVTRTPSRDAPIEQINFADCINDATLTFGLTKTGFVDNTNLKLEVWAQNGVNCADNEVRNNQTGCWKLAEVAPTENTVVVRAQDIVAQRNVPPAATEEVCTMPPVSGESDFVLAFLILNSSGVSQTTEPAAIWPPMATARYDVVGPQPPTNVTGSPGGGSAILSFDPSTDDDLEGYNAFCTIATSTGDGDGGACAGEGLVMGQVPVSPATDCGTAGQFAEELTADDLEDNVTYAIGVSARDNLDNNGPISNLTCISPRPTTGFYEAYRAAGGTAGGGFCALSRRPSPLSFGVILAALAGLALRRRRPL